MNTNKNDFPSFFIINNLKVTKEHEIAERFNSFFANIGPKLAAKQRTCNVAPFSIYLTNQTEERFSFAHMAPCDIEEIITDLKPKTSTGNDNLSTKLLKHINTSIAPPLAFIINQSLNTGIFAGNC